MQTSVRRLGLAMATVLAVSVLYWGPVAAAEPGTGSIGASNASVAWTGPDVTAETAGPTDADCTAPADPLPGFCDDFFLTVTDLGDVTFTLTGVTPAEDFDLYIYDKDGNEVGNSALPLSAEALTLECADPAASPYKARAVYFLTVDDGVPVTPGYNADASWSAHEGTCDAEGEAGPATFVDDSLAFAPATIVSATFLGSEPQVTLERTVSNARPGAGIDPNRVFIDWPLSSRSNIGQLSRSLDGGDSFRLLFDPKCAERSRPNCLTGGGGDTENEVNLHTGTLMFSDQEALANEAYAVSFDHGDTFLVQSPVSNTTTATDRQWVATTDASVTLASTDRKIEGILTYHVPPTLYAHAIDESGFAVPQPVPQLSDVGQSGQPRVDNNPDSPGHGWIYHPYIGFLNGGTWVATADSRGFALPTDWEVNRVSSLTTTSFPWMWIDNTGNAHIVWDNGGVIWYAYSLIHDPANNPQEGGRPGTKWSDRLRVSPPEVGSAVFPEVAAGDAGRVAIAFDGTTEHTGSPDSAPEDTHWNTYAVIIPNALEATPTAHVGIVSHRYIHMGDICTGGLGCTTDSTQDRSLLDMIDLGYDDAGRVGVVYTDNYSSFQEVPNTEDEPPFSHFAKQTAGPSILASKSPINLSVPTGARDDPAGDATWPNVKRGTNLPSLDATGLSLARAGGDVVARLSLANASVSQTQADLATYNAQTCVPVVACLAERVQYVVRISTATELYHLSMETLADGSRRFYGGILDANDKIVNVASPNAMIAAGYHTDAGFPVTGSVEGNTIVLSAPASAFRLADGDPVYSVTAFAMAGPTEALELTNARLNRTVDATPPFDATLREPRADVAVSTTDSPDPVKRGRDVTYTVTVSNNGPDGASGVTLTDTLPAGTFRSATASQGSCSRSGGSVTCSLGSLAAGASATVTIVMTAPGPPNAPGSISNVASVSAAGPPDPNAANNSDTETTTVRK